jgi:single-strand DNA-binding protein
MNYNQVTLIGRLCTDPVEKSTPNGKVYAGFNLAVNNGYGRNAEASFFHVRVWGQAAAVVLRYSIKGSELLVNGELRQERWEKDGRKHDRILVNAWKVELGPKPRSAEQPKSDPYAAPEPEQPQAASVEADDVPF